MMLLALLCTAGIVGPRNALPCLPEPPNSNPNPRSTSFDHLRIADEAQFRFDRAVRALGPATATLPTYGVGHGLGSLIQLLICARYAVQVQMRGRAAGALLMGRGRGYGVRQGIAIGPVGRGKPPCARGD